MSVDPAPWSDAPVASPATRPRTAGHGAVASLRRYRAERLLARDFESQRAAVLRRVRARCSAHGMRVAESDLEACYAQAWQGLYATVLAGGQISSTVAWLVVVTFRRAVECQRAQRATAALDDVGDLAGGDPDVAGLIDDRDRLRQVFEGLRGRLSARECEAATLCYLQGLSRAEAAARMGISERRLYKLMDGDGRERPGVAGKVGALVGAIRSGRFCEEQASLMRGLAFGVLDPAGERHRLAVVHQRECPACRAYVASLRRLAAVIPAPALPLALGTAGGAGAGAGAGTAGTAAGLGGGAAGVGTASGGWLLAGGGLGAKVAGCLIVLGIGAGCVTLGLPVRIGHSSPPAVRRASAAHVTRVAAHARDHARHAQPRPEHRSRTVASTRPAPVAARPVVRRTVPTAAPAAVAAVARATAPVHQAVSEPERSLRTTVAPRHGAARVSASTASSQFSFERSPTTPAQPRRMRRRTRRHARTPGAAVHPLTVETLARAAAAPPPAVAASATATASAPPPSSPAPAPHASAASSGSAPSGNRRASGRASAEFGFETGGG